MDIDFFLKMKYVCFYNLIVSHYILLLKMINDKTINGISFDFHKIETVFVKELKKSNFLYSEIGKQMYPETLFKEKPINNYIKKTKKKQKVSYKFFYFFLFFLMFSLVLYGLFFIFRLSVLGYQFFFFCFSS